MGTVKRSLEKEGGSEDGLSRQSSDVKSKQCSRGFVIINNLRSFLCGLYPRLHR